MSCVCGVQGKFICGNCKINKYCSVNCQKADWKEHKKVCKTASQTEDEILWEFQNFMGSAEPLDCLTKNLSMDQKVHQYSKALAYWNMKCNIKNCPHEMSEIFQSAKDETLIMIQKNFPDFVQRTIIDKAANMIKK